MTEKQNPAGGRPAGQGAANTDDITSISPKKPKIQDFDLDEFIVSNNGSKPSEAEERPQAKSWGVGELFATTFPEPKWAIPGLIPEGLVWLAGRPKTGKSFLLLQIAQAVATGGFALGERVEAGKAVYFALEDSPRRIKQRLITQGCPEKAEIEFYFELEPLSKGGADALEIIALSKPRIIILDTFTRALGQVDQNDQASMAEVVGGLQSLATRQSLTLLVCDHHRKVNGFDSDPIDDILGSTSKAATIDAALGLYRDRGKRETCLKIIGRELEEKTLALGWDALTCCWQNLGDADRAREDSEKGRVLAAIEAIFEDGDLPTTTRIGEKANMAKPNVSSVIQGLVMDGLVARGAKIGVQQPYYPVSIIDNNNNIDNNG